MRLVQLIRSHRSVQALHLQKSELDVKLVTVVTPKIEKQLVEGEKP